MAPSLYKITAGERSILDLLHILGSWDLSHIASNCLQ